MQNSTKQSPRSYGYRHAWRCGRRADVPGISHPHHARFRQAGCVGAARADRQPSPMGPSAGIARLPHQKPHQAAQHQHRRGIGELFNFVMGALLRRCGGPYLQAQQDPQERRRRRTAWAQLVMAVVQRAGATTSSAYPVYVVMYHRPHGCHHRRCTRPSTPMSTACWAACWSSTCPSPSSRALLDAVLCFLVYKPLSPDPARPQISTRAEECPTFEQIG